MLNKLLVKEGNATQLQVDALKIFDATKKNLEQEIVSYKRQAQRQRKEIYDLEKERESYLQQAAEVTQKCKLFSSEAMMGSCPCVEVSLTPLCGSTLRCPSGRGGKNEGRDDHGPEQVHRGNGWQAQAAAKPVRGRACGQEYVLEEPHRGPGRGRRDAAKVQDSGATNRAASGRSRLEGQGARDCPL
jgi:CFAP58 central coiled coil